MYVVAKEVVPTLLMLRPEITKLISIRDHHAAQDSCPALNVTWLPLQFDDVTRDLLAYGYLAPKASDVELALQFLPTREPCAIHCGAGVSRSAGIALAIATQWALAENEAEPERAAIRTLLAAIDRTEKMGLREECVMPNAKIVEYADQLLNRGGKLMEIYRNIEWSTTGTAEGRAIILRLHGPREQ